MDGLADGDAGTDGEGATEGDVEGLGEGLGDGLGDAHTASLSNRTPELEESPSFGFPALTRT